MTDAPLIQVKITHPQREVAGALQAPVTLSALSTADCYLIRDALSVIDPPDERSRTRVQRLMTLFETAAYA